MDALASKSKRNMYEILLRLIDDDGRLITPGKYMPAAERFSMMRKVDHWVIRQSIQQLASAVKRFPGTEITLFINISSNSLIDVGLAEFVVDLQQRHNLPPRSICLEISEDKAIKNLEPLKEIIAKTRKHDILFALDDFGTGIASFSYLKDLPVDFIKINGTIIKSIAHSSTDRAMVAAIARIGEMLNIRTVGKHVEDAFTQNQLKSLGIDYAQGYYLGKPQPVEDCFGRLKPSEQLSESRK
jgi:Amt family ammonium transporter